MRLPYLIYFIENWKLVRRNFMSFLPQISVSYSSAPSAGLTGSSNWRDRVDDIGVFLSVFLQ